MVPVLMEIILEYLHKTQRCLSCGPRSFWWSYSCQRNADKPGSTKLKFKAKEQRIFHASLSWLLHFYKTTVKNPTLPSSRVCLRFLFVCVVSIMIHSIFQPFCGVKRWSEQRLLNSNRLATSWLNLSCQGHQSVIKASFLFWREGF